MKISLGKETIVSQAPADVRYWGPWQFPRFFDGGEILYLEFHISADSAKSYGNPRRWFLSVDRGKTWDPCDNGGMQLENGDLVKPHQPRAVPEADIELPASIGKFVGYGFSRDYYDYTGIGAEYRGWYIERRKPGGEWEIEEVSVELPGYTMNTSEGVFPMNYFHHLKTGPGGTVWSLPYKHFLDDGVISSHSASWYLKSEDCCRTFEFVGRVPYAYDLRHDPGAEARYGFGEPDICFVGNGRAFSLHRTTDGTGIGPMYITWTDDGGYTWTSPEFFDDRGVWPQTVRLDNGVVLAGYGRPGLFVRPYHEGVWHYRLAVVPPGECQTETCSYCALAAVDGDTALIAYSDFNLPALDGTPLGAPLGAPRKTIVCRTVTVEI